MANLNESPVKLLETKIIADHDLKLNLHGLDLIEVDFKAFLILMNVEVLFIIKERASDS